MFQRHLCADFSYLNVEQKATQKRVVGRQLYAVGDNYTSRPHCTLLYGEPRSFPVVTTNFAFESQSANPTNWRDCRRTLAIITRLR